MNNTLTKYYNLKSATGEIAGCASFTYLGCRITMNVKMSVGVSYFRDFVHVRFGRAMINMRLTKDDANIIHKDLLSNRVEMAILYINHPDSWILRGVASMIIDGYRFEEV